MTCHSSEWTRETTAYTPLCWQTTTAAEERSGVGGATDAAEGGAVLESNWLPFLFTKFEFPTDWRAACASELMASEVISLTLQTDSSITKWRSLRGRYD